MKEITKVGERIAYQNAWIKVREDDIVLQNGDQSIYGVVEKPDFSVIIPFDNGHIHLVEQYRYTVGSRFWEFPQGGIEEEDQDQLEAAKRELQEEAGLLATNFQYLGFLYEGYGFCTQGFHAYLATGLTKGEQKLDLEEYGMISSRFELAQFEQMLIEGVIKDSVTVAAYGLAKMKNLI